MDVKELLRRRKTISVDSDFILMVLNFASQRQKIVMLPVMDEIPEGTEVVGVHSDFYSNRIHLQAVHPSFDVVPEGERSPEFILMGGDWRAVYVDTFSTLADHQPPFQKPFTNPRSGMGVPKS
jgi:hypothetical protein